jgi:hypothetical protein
VQASKQLTANVLFEAAYVPADRGLRYVQLTRGLCETQSPRGCFEGAQGEE